MADLARAFHVHSENRRVIVLRNYIVFVVLKGVGKVLAVLVVVAGFLQLVGQLDDVGVAEYGLSEALSFVALGMPRTIFQSMPAAALIGSLLSLGDLAVHRELIVMRAAGISKWQLVTSVGLAGFGLAVVMALLGESLAPSLGAYARQMRAEALLEEGTLADAQSTWLKDGNRILNLRRNVGEFSFESGIYLFELGRDHELLNIAHADSADIAQGDGWILANYAETRFFADGITALRLEESARDYGLNAELLELSIVREDLLDTPGLQRYIAYLQSNGLDADRYLIAYWGRIARVAAVVFMTMLALPFVFGGLRTAGTGGRLIAGLVLGLAFYVADEMLANSSEVFQLDPLLVAWAPTAVLGLAAAVAIARFR
jgi:lipopolysaccharide export system permease protein